MNSVSSPAWTRWIEGRIWEDGLRTLEDLRHVINVEIVQHADALDAAAALA